MKNSSAILPYLLLLLMLCCVGRKTCLAANLSLSFLPYFKEEKLQLSDKLYARGKADSLKISNLKCYVGQLRIQFLDGSIYEDATAYHLLDYSEANSMIISLSSVPDKQIAALSFYLGVDSAVNVQGAMGGDLDPVKGMYWAWNSGYINLKIEGYCNACNTRDHSFELHVGGFQTPYATRQLIQLPIKQVSVQRNIQVKMDIAAFLEGIDFSKVNSIVMPGKAAADIAKNGTHAFSIIEN